MRSQPPPSFGLLVSQQISSQAGSGEQGSGRRATQESGFDPFSCTSEVPSSRVSTPMHVQTCLPLFAANILIQHALCPREVVTCPPVVARLLVRLHVSIRGPEGPELTFLPLSTASPQVGNATARGERPDNSYTRAEIKGNGMGGGKATSEHGEGRAGATGARTRPHDTRKTSSQLPERAWAPELTAAASNKAKTQTIAKGGSITTQSANWQAASGGAPYGASPSTRSHSPSERTHSSKRTH